jgi:5-enolpyruvylshikimate-3-phosphate synthase
MAFAFALLGCLWPDVLVSDPDCVAKSWASFWSDLERLGAVLVRELRE